MAKVSLKNISKQFGDTVVLQDISLDIENEEMMVFVGPSGCGKSTLLRLIAGFETPTQGEILIDNKPVNNMEPSGRGLAMVFQSYALYPHMTVEQNISYCLKNLKVNKAEIKKKVSQVAETLQILNLLNRYPNELSGGQRQRVAIGRALIRDPQIYLFDEPLSNLDALLRLHTRVEIAKLHQQHRKTMIYVTHDQVEAMTLASRIAIINKGRIEQVGAPLELYESPKNLFVAGFLGSPSMGFIPGELKSATATETLVQIASGVTVRVQRDARKLSAHSPVTLGIRPERLRLTENKNGLPAQVSVVERLGNRTVFHCVLENGTSLVAEQEFNNFTYKTGDSLFLELPSSETHLFNSQGLALSRLPV